MSYQQLIKTSQKQNMDLEHKIKLPVKFNRFYRSSWRCEELDQNYHRLEQVGSGTYGCVYKAERRRDGKVVAIKKMAYFEDNKNQEGFPITTLRQIKLLQNLDHPNILNINQVLIRKVKDSFPIVHICLDYMDYDLDKFVMEKQYEMNVAQIRYIMKQLLWGLEYLHKNDVVHRDLKPKNILVNKQGLIKIADFGLAKMIRNRQYLTVKVVTLWYRAPELILGQRNYTTKVDIWSLGCLMVQLLIRRPLFCYQQNQRDMINKIYEYCGTPDVNDWQEQISNLETYKATKPANSIQNQFKDKIKSLCLQFESQNLMFDLLQRLMELNPYKRFSASEALAHSFFKQPLIQPSQFIPPEIIQKLSMRSKPSQLQGNQKRYKH